MAPAHRPSWSAARQRGQAGLSRNVPVPGPLLQLSIGPPGRTSPPQGKALLGRCHTLGAPLTGRQAPLPTRKSPRPSAPPCPPGPLLQLSVRPPGRTSPPQGKALLGRLHTLSAPLAGCRARAPSTGKPAALCASASQAPTWHLRVRSLARLRLAGVRLPRSRQCRPGSWASQRGTAGRPLLRQHQN
ncbi:hypothetical protein NDU88_003743 [Pleurodeles waltl]|uniref:Uncharacterized protein n=1 Tax=Pleurodeles waltl TaxID=8319 RepID=A0AAV7UZC1_PLEWA|nr:hypothetical protein NDU88_003743 [Pleurodeles waltl]